MSFLVSINMLIFLNVFVKNLWFGIAGAVAMISLCFLVIARLSGSISKLHSAQDSESFGPLNSIALVMLVYMQRDYSIYKYGLSTRYNCGLFSLNGLFILFLPDRINISNGSYRILQLFLFYLLLCPLLKFAFKVGIPYVFISVK